jgi:hypothetical protein
MLLVEFLNRERGVRQVLEWFPSIFFSGVSFPVYKIMELLPEILRISDEVDFVFLLSINNDRGWRRWTLLRGVGGFMIEGEVFFVEDWGDPAPKRWKFDFIGTPAYFLDDGERSVSSVLQFLGPAVSPNILPFNVNEVSFFICRSGSSVFIVLSFHTVISEFECGLRVVACMFESISKFVSSFVFCLASCLGSRPRVLSAVKEEGSLFCGGVLAVVITKLRRG